MADGPKDLEAFERAIDTLPPLQRIEARTLYANAWEDADALRHKIREAVTFLDNRRADGIDFPYDSWPLRKLREAAPD